MRQKIYLVLILLAGLQIQTRAQELPIIKFPALQEMINEADSLVIFNFWATWCRPCVAELPDFAEVARQNPTRVKIVLISLDYAEDASTKTLPFLHKKQFGLDCYLLDETKYDQWMPKINPQWDGSIPATLVVNKAKKTFHFISGTIHKDELQAIVEKFQ